MSSARTTSTRRARRALYEDAVAVIDAECRRDLEVGDVAHRIGTSRRQLQRVFVEVGGTSFSDHLTRRCLERAAVMLREGRRPLHQVARAVGYGSPSAFSAAFRRHHGVPPSAMRRRDR